MSIFSGPEFINWNFTYACNLNCKHCYSRADRYPRELGPLEYLRVAEQIVRANTFSVALGGGEPLVRKDVFDIVSFLSEAGVHTLVTTNGWYVDDEVCGRLRSSGLATLYVSLDSVKPEIHDSIRGNGSYERALSCLRRALKQDLKVMLSTVLSQQNYLEIPSFVDLATTYGLSGIEFKKFRPSGNGNRNQLSFNLNETSVSAIHELAGVAKGSRSLSIQFLGFGPAPGTDATSSCPCGTRSLCIRPNGDVSHCSYSDVVCGNLMRTELCDLWLTSDSIAAIRAQKSCSADSGAISPSNPALAQAAGGIKEIKGGETYA